MVDVFVPGKQGVVSSSAADENGHIRNLLCNFVAVAKLATMNCLHNSFF